MYLNLGKKWECSKCSKTFKTKNNFNHHVITHDPDAQKKCEVCGKILKNPVSLAVHMTRAHTNRERPKCDICLRPFFDSATLRGHMDALHGSRKRPRFPCTFPACEKTYLSEGSLTRHLKTDHAENPVRFPCTLCAKEFKFRRNLEAHISTHTTEKPFKCATCGQRFARRQGLKGHQATHLEEYTPEIFKCQLCLLTCCSSSGLKRHVRAVHENLRNYPCTFCTKKFSESYTLKNHAEAVHPANKEKIHACDKCEYRSHSKGNLANHKRWHDPKKHECYFCGWKFVLFRHLVHHCGRIHTLEEKLLA